MNTTQLLLSVPLVGRGLLHAKAAVYEALGRCPLHDLSRYRDLPRKLRRPTRRLLTFFLGAGEAADETHDGMMEMAERVALTRYAAAVPKGQAIVELGSFTGVGTCFLAVGARNVRGNRVWAVDTFAASTTDEAPWQAYRKKLQRRGGSTLPAFRRNLRMCGLERVAEPVVGRTTDVAHTWDAGRIGLLLIDADHAYEFCRADYLAWKPHLADGALVLFHDHQPAFPGVVRAVAELLESEPLESVETVRTLRICRYGAASYE